MPNSLQTFKERVNEENQKFIISQKIKQKKLNRINNIAGISGTGILFGLGIISVPLLIFSLTLQGISLAANVIVKIKPL